MADIEKIERKTRKVVIWVAAVSFVVIVISGVLTDLFNESAANQQRQRQQHPDSLMLGRLHIKYAADKETPYVDVAVDRDTLRAWRGIFVDHEGPQTTAEIARDYGKLVSAHKLISVEPDTLVRVLEKQDEYDCLVSVIAGKDATRSGWVDCRWIVK